MNDQAKQIARMLLDQQQTLAAAAVEKHYALHPEFNARYGEPGRAKCLQDANYNIQYLAEAIASQNISLFADYISWLKVMLARRNVTADDLSRHLELLQSVLEQHLPKEASNATRFFIDAGRKQLPLMPLDLPSFIQDQAPSGALARQYLHHLLRGERQMSSQLIMDAAKQGVPVKDIYLNVFQPAQYEIGRLWQVNQISVAQEHYCTAATQLIMSQLYPYIFSTTKGAGRLVATCVGGELHEIGVRMVADFFEMDGWDTYYLGASTPIESVVKTIVDRKAQALAISATITYHVRAVESMIQAVRASDDCRGVKILVGGYPFNVASDLWRTVGADGYAGNAQEAIPLANELVGLRNN